MPEHGEEDARDARAGSVYRTHARVGRGRSRRSCTVEEQRLDDPKRDGSQQGGRLLVQVPASRPVCACAAATAPSRSARPHRASCNVRTRNGAIDVRRGSRGAVNAWRPPTAPIRLVRPCRLRSVEVSAANGSVDLNGVETPRLQRVHLQRARARGAALVSAAVPCAVRQRPHRPAGRPADVAGARRRTGFGRRRGRPDGRGVAARLRTGHRGR